MRPSYHEYDFSVDSDLRQTRALASNFRATRPTSQGLRRTRYRPLPVKKMTRLTPCRAVFAVVAILSATHGEPAFAGRPFATEDAAVLERGACELESYAAYARSRADPSERSASVQLGCGAGLDTQLAVVAARFTTEDARHAIAGVTGKTALRPLTETDAGITVAYSLKGKRAPHSDLHHEESALSLVFTLPLDRRLVHANLGALRTESDKRTTGTYGFAVERLGERGLDYGLEVFGEFNASPWIGAGARYSVQPQKLFVDASFAVQTNSARSRQVTVGVKYAF